MNSKVTPEQLHQVEEMNHRWHEKYPIIKAIDSDPTRRSRLPGLAKQELLEAKGELDLIGNPDFGVDLLAGEILDSIVITTIFRKIVRTSLDYAKVVSNANGQASSSNYWESTSDVLEGMADGDIEENISQGLVLLVSGFNHLPEKRNIVTIASEVVEKNISNRPPEYYTPYDVDGTLLNPEGQLEKYRHVEQMLRILRKTYGSPLERWMHEPYKMLILDFRNSDKNAELLQMHIRDLDSLLAIHVLSYEHSESMTPRQRQRGLLLAGGQLVGEPSRVVYPVM